MTAEPHLLVIFRASADLTKRKLLRALLSLVHNGLLLEPFYILGFTELGGIDKGFRHGVSVHLNDKKTSPHLAWLRQQLFYWSGYYTDRGAMETLKERIRQMGANGVWAGIGSTTWRPCLKFLRVWWRT